MSLLYAILSTTLALFYYTLGNIHPRYRSTIRCIQLLTVTKSSILQEYGADAILEPFMDNIKSLEQVLVVTVA